MHQHLIVGVGIVGTTLSRHFYARLLSVLVDRSKILFRLLI